jgi:hypothetical protein
MPMIFLCWIHSILNGINNFTFCPKDKRKLFGHQCAFQINLWLILAQKSKKLKWNFIMINLCLAYAAKT